MITEAVIISLAILFLFVGFLYLIYKDKIDKDSYLYESIHVYLLDKIEELFKKISINISIKEHYTFGVILLWFLILWGGGFIISLIEGYVEGYVMDLRWYMGFISFGIAFLFIGEASKYIKRSINKLNDIMAEDIELKLNISDIINNKMGFWVIWILLSLIPIGKFLIGGDIRTVCCGEYGSSYLLSFWAMLMWICSCFFTATWVYFNIRFIQKYVWRLPKLKYKYVYAPARVSQMFLPTSNISFGIPLLWAIGMFYVFIIFTENTFNPGYIDAIESIIFIIGTLLSLLAVFIPFLKIHETIEKIKNTSIEEFSNLYEKEIVSTIKEKKENSTKAIVYRNHIIDIQSVPDITIRFSSSIIVISLTILINIVNSLNVIRILINTLSILVTTPLS
ncbi:MAG: hypothetical protein CVT88_00290 [Candidatus Altiarchaeales archaeon HGW-Altiarchaeales-1]|nr:MAG: hypothetical protein CVT88_00290 [Candidatus Altiarchaeales archaeon HGW-Altiarchaeales-1]